MIIHVVQPGETLSSISSKYNIPVITLIRENGITNPDNLAIGQTIIIVYPLITYTVQEGDSLLSIAFNYNVSVMELLRNNPHLSDREYIYPGETIVISYETNKIRSIAVSGYTYTYIDKNILKKTLPYLSYLTIFNYKVTFTGDLIDIRDEEIIRMAKDYGVAPMMLLSTLTETGERSNEITQNIINNMQVQNRLFENVVTMLRKKGYYGINIYLEYIEPENRAIIEEYIKRFTKRLHEEGFRVLVTLSPKTNIEQNEVSFEKIDYVAISQIVDAMLFLSYQWGSSLGPPASVTPVNIVEEYIQSIITQIPPSKIFLGLPIIGYDWQLPYIPGASRANAISNEAAIELATEVGAIIKYNAISQAPYYFYNSIDNELHLVWFKDARSIEAISRLVPEYGLQGLSVWNIMQFFTQMWFVINTEYDIEKVIRMYNEK